jgi:hypothetical protein
MVLKEDAGAAAWACAAAWAGWIPATAIPATAIPATAIPATAIPAMTMSATARDFSVRNKAISPQIDGRPEPQKGSASSTGFDPRCKSRSLPKKSALLFSNRLWGREQT